MKEIVLVCLSSSQINGRVIQAAYEMSKAFHAELIGVYVETSKKKKETQQTQLQLNIEYAKSLNINVNYVYGDDVAFQIAQFANYIGAQKIVIGQSKSKSIFIHHQSISDQLIEYLTDINVYIIPDKNAFFDKKERFSFKGKDIVIMLLELLVTSCIGLCLAQTGMNDADIITIYILGVLVNSLLTSNPLLNGIDSFLSVIIFNFLFTDPKYTLFYYDNGYVLTFLIMFCSSFITGTLAWQLKSYARTTSKIARHTKTLLETNQLLNRTRNKEEILNVTISQIKLIVNKNIVVYLQEDVPFYYEKSDEAILKKEIEVVEWIFNHHESAGATTNYFEQAKYVYFPLHIQGRTHGVFGICLDGKGLEMSQKNMILSILMECSMALENDKNAREKEESLIRANNEKLRADLLRTISHDLRTPLTSIIGCSNTLIENGNSLSEEMRHGMLESIYKDSLWLNEMIENVLSITKIEQGKIALKKTPEVVEEIVEEAVHRVHCEHHIIYLEPSKEIYVVKMDAQLIIQVLVNILNNAIKYVPEQTTITIQLKDDDSYVYIYIKDQGKGIKDKDKIFEMFYRGQHEVIDDERGLGLGLSLCKSIVELHKGKIWVEDNVPHGSVFVVALLKDEEHEKDKYISC